MPAKLTNEEFQNRINTLHPNFKMLGQYKNSHTPVHMKCLDCGCEWDPLPTNCLKGRACPFCAGKRPIPGKTDFASQHPELLKEWDYDRNIKLPDEYTECSNQKVYWIGKCGHQWEAYITNRVREKAGCPICAGKVVVSGINDLESQNPELASEWDYYKNEQKPSEVFVRSKKKAWWICPIGHSYYTYIFTRSTRGTDCPICDKSGTSFQEQAIFYYLHQIYPDSINRYNDEGFELDIFIPSLQVGIEYDGVAYHVGKAQNTRDLDKNRKCQKLGIKLIRVRENGLAPLPLSHCIMRKNNDSSADLDECISKLVEYLPGDNVLGINVSLDHFNIRKQYYEYVKRVNLENTNPELSGEWNYELNGSLKPNMVTPSSHIEVYWKCRSHPDHVWKDSIAHRSSGRGCPYCSSQRILPGFNDLAFLRPDLAKEWSEHNTQKPDMVAVNTSHKYLWTCSKGHEYAASPANRAKGKGCPYCSGNKAITGQNDLASLFPNLLEEWDYQKNSINPHSILPYSDAIVWWKCSKGHSYDMRINKRTRRNQGCPYCSGNRIIPGETDLATLNPVLAKQWHPVKNGDLLPSQVMPNSNSKAWWLCPICGNEWEAYICNRNKSKYPYCPKCNRLLSKGKLQEISS